MKRLAIFLIGILLITPSLSAAPTIERTDDQLQVRLDHGTVLTFALHDGMLLGLHSASHGDHHLTSDQTVLRPIIAQDHGKTRHIIQSYRLREAKVADGKVIIELQALATTDADHLQHVFVMRADRERAIEEGMTPRLRALSDAADMAQARLHEAALTLGDDRLNNFHRDWQQARQGLETLGDAGFDTYRHGLLLEQERRQRQRFNSRLNQLMPQLLEAHPGLADARAAINTWNQAIDEHARNFQVIHRDFYRFPIWRQPAEITTVEHAKDMARLSLAEGKPVGTIRWIIEPYRENIAGWAWLGWQQSFSFDLIPELRVNHFAVLGTWELGGQAAGSNLIALRYRGLGGLTQSLTDAGDGKVAEAFSTTEIIPGAAGGAPAISPVITGPEISGDRAFALRHRVGAWIAQPARGAGGPFLDVQHRDGVMFTAIPRNQGNLRAVTEVMPDDRVISQTDLEYFALNHRHETIPIRYLVLSFGSAPFSISEIRTRYQELDQHVRDLVSKELGFVQFDVLPGAHYMFDHNFGGQKAALAANIPNLAAEGVRRIETHHPGWVNGRVRDPGMAHIGGGVCDIYDYWPLREAANPWKALTQAGADHQVAYYVWLTGMARIDGPLHQRIGRDIERWAFNEPNPRSLLLDSTGYQGNSNLNVHNEETRRVLLEQLDKAQREFGFQGFWADSFQNLFMSQLDWAQGTGDSLQRKWWEIIAQWTRDGISWTSESHSFPGQSCSIEVQGGWNADNFFLTTHVNRAFRANSFPDRGQPAADRLAFGFMANKGWAAPDLRPQSMPSSVVPSFKRLAHEYLAALPHMRRSIQLPDNKGVLWLSYAGNDEGVLFSMADQPLPAGVRAVPILGGEPVTEARDIHTYRVSADNLLRAFGIRTGPMTDPRIGRQWEAPEYNFPEWTRPSPQ